jgi:hypothetical protein
MLDLSLRGLSSFNQMLFLLDLLLMSSCTLITLSQLLRKHLMRLKL